MPNVAQLKRWKISEAFLRRAHEALPRPASEDARFGALEKEFFEYLDHNEHELALDMLQELGEVAVPRGGFWKDLIRSAENMELKKRIAYLEMRHHEALSRVAKDGKTA